MREKLTRWVYGAPNLVGCALVLVGVGLFMAGVISGPLVAPIVGGLYLLGAVATPRPKGLKTEVHVPGAVDPIELKTSLDDLVSESLDRLPDTLATKVAAIRQTILDILPKVNDSTIDRQDLFALEKTVTEYLPETLDNYLTLPRGYANNRVVANGKTAEQLLAGQLDLINQKMQAISEAVAKDDLSKLLAQGRFLEERFGKNDELKIGSQGTAQRR
jgi:hypothetical protein